MSYGYQREARTFLNNTITLAAYLYDMDGETLVPRANISAVQFTIVAPDGDPTAPVVNAANATSISDGTGIYVVANTVNVVAGEYRGIAVFNWSDGHGAQITSVPVDYNVNDPFERAGASTSDPAVDLCWTKLEDVFDSELGGPWLRDQTLGRFDKSKVRALLPDVFFEINGQQPQTDYTPEGFNYTANDDKALVAQGLMVHTVKHLMRSYAEQPDVVGNEVNFFNRQRYLDTWTKIYQIELERWKVWLEQWKLRIYNQSSTKLLIANKAGRLIPAPMRSRYAGRGFY